MSVIGSLDLVVGADIADAQKKIGALEGQLAKLKAKTDGGGGLNPLAGGADKAGKGLGLVTGVAGAAAAGIVAVGAAALGAATALGALTMHELDAIDQLQDVSERTGITVKAISGLGYAAKMSATDQETLVGGLDKMNKKLGDVQSGEASAAKAFTDLGLSTKELIEAQPDVAFAKIADKISQLPNQWTFSGRAASTWCRSWTRGPTESTG
jgi:hypothetical protein